MSFEECFTHCVQARTSYSRSHSEPGSRCTSALSPGPPMYTPDPFLMPVQSATFHKTTAAKKISTNEFKQGEFEELKAVAGPFLQSLAG